MNDEADCVWTWTDTGATSRNHCPLWSSSRQSYDTTIADPSPSAALCTMLWAGVVIDRGMRRCLSGSSTKRFHRVDSATTLRQVHEYAQNVQNIKSPWFRGVVGYHTCLTICSIVSACGPRFEPGRNHYFCFLPLLCVFRCFDARFRRRHGIVCAL